VKASNPFQAGVQKIVPAVLLYAFYKNQILMIQKQDHWNGLGGKLDLVATPPGEASPEAPLRETPLDAAVREFREEAGIETRHADWHWLGQLWFPDFKAALREDWWVTVFWTELTAEQASKIPTGTLMDEGTLHWVPSRQVMNLNLWDGDREFLPFVLNRKPFQGTLHYQNGKCSQHDSRPIF
jgi:8-oxo-dGTP diphosphatase